MASERSKGFKFSSNYWVINNNLRVRSTVSLVACFNLEIDRKLYDCVLIDPGTPRNVGGELGKELFCNVASRQLIADWPLSVFIERNFELSGWGTNTFSQKHLVRTLGTQTSKTTNQCPGFLDPAKKYVSSVIVVSSVDKIWAYNRSNTVRKCCTLRSTVHEGENMFFKCYNGDA